MHYIFPPISFKAMVLSEACHPNALCPAHCTPALFTHLHTELATGRLLYRGDGVYGVHDGEQQHVVNAAGVVRVARPGDLLTGGVVDEGGVARDVHLVLRRIGHCATGAVQVLVLYQGLPLLGHHHHKAEGMWKCKYNTWRT